MREKLLRARMMQVRRGAAGVLRIFEFQGEFEHLELFDGIFDESTLQMRFGSFYLQGRAVSKKMTLVEKMQGASAVELHARGHINEVILFDSPPRYILS